MRKTVIIAIVFLVSQARAQQANVYVQKGNFAYGKGGYREAIEFYNKALLIDPENTPALYNTGNALYKLSRYADAERYFKKFDDAVDRDTRFKAAYNKGVAQALQHKIPDAIESFKQALLLNPADNDARENLQKAINELKQQQARQPQNNKQQPKQQKNNQKQASQEMIDQKFNELRDKEKQLQKMLRKSSSTKNPDKDW